ncbi:TPA: phage antirepressor KilAC domain-containing protein [Klebsiella aerogenes]|nr:phage antirepressor KilAC domain-containing protein [Klebsiella aerogenes]
MRTSLITREEMIEAIENHTICISTGDIPSVAATYLMITKELYTRKDRNVINRILLSEIRDYLVEQGRIPYAGVAALKKQEAKEVERQIITEQSNLSLLPSSSADSIDSQQLLKLVNEARKLYGEPAVRNNKFIEKILDELDGEDGYTKGATVPQRGGTPMVVITMTYKQALRIAARESKAVRRSLIDKLEELQQALQPSPTPAIPQSLPEALRLAADLAEQKQQLEQQLTLAAPKVDFADRISNANGILIGNFAKVVGLKQNFLFGWLRDHGVLISVGSRRNVPKQQYIDQGYFSVRESVIENEKNSRIALTTHITGKGQQWLTRKLLEAKILKPVPAK